MLLGGSPLVHRPPAFSNDGKKLLVCTGNTVSIYSVSTALLVGELVGHKGKVTSVIVVPAKKQKEPANECHCWTSSMDASLRLWDFNTAAVLRIVKVVRPVVSMVIPDFLRHSIDREKKRQDLYAFLSIDWKENHDGRVDDWNGRLRIHNLTKMKEIEGQLKLKYRQRLLVASPSGKLVGVADRRVLHIWKTPDEEIVNPKEMKKLRLHHINKFSTLAFHPSDTIVAGGDISGRILIWRGVGERSFSSGDMLEEDENFSYHVDRFDVRSKDDVMSRTTWHWHNSAVNFLSFSVDGTHLYSGAKEGVLVIWQMESGKRQYFPRLGGPLRFLANSPDPSFFSISCADNKILFANISTTMIEKSIEGIKPPFSLHEKIQDQSGCRPAVDYKGGMLVLPAENHSVQFYDLYYDRPVSEIQVSQRNYIPATETTVLVTLVALSGDASVMGTVEYRLPEHGIGSGYSLKFWSAESRSGKFSISTVIDEPHSDAGVSALSFHPWKHMAASTSYVGNFKIWIGSKSVSANHGLEQNRGWRCQSVGSYKDEAMLCSGFSADGSLLAVGAGGLVTFWNPETNSLVSVIGDSLDLMPISALTFIPKSKHHLVTISEGLRPCLYVWNLSTLSIWWSYHLSVEAITTDPVRPNFVVLALLPVHVRNKLKMEEDAVILLFDVKDPIPLAAWAVRKGIGGTVAFIQECAHLHEEDIDESKQEENRLVFLNSEHEYAVFNPYSSDDEACLVPRLRFSSIQDPGLSGYRTIFGNIPDQEPNTDKYSHIDNRNVVQAATSRPWGSIFSGPSHVLPPLTRVGVAFMESLLEKRSSQD